MIRDGDGKDPEELASQLCHYYDERNLEDVDQLPRVTRRNVLILKYYSFENYFLNPKIMAALGIVESEEMFYSVLYEKWNEYLYRLRSGQQLIQVLGRNFTSPKDIKEHLEEIKIYLRGHNLYDIFYGPFKDLSLIHILFCITPNTPILRVANVTHLGNGQIMDYTELTLNSVSYTHLDVYKRQARRFLYFSYRSGSDTKGKWGP